MTHGEYIAYLKSDHWRQIAAAAKSLAGHRCRVCNGGDRLQVHHRSYERLGNELPGDVTVLCDTCHRMYHKSRRLPRRPGAARARDKRGRWK